jgi:uncharacterized protein YjiS (DUF1127 family)
MAEITTNAPRWALGSLVQKLRLWCLDWLRPTDALPPLSDHMARDLGLTPAQLERHRLRLPSQLHRHPML